MTRWSAFCQPPNSYTTSWDSTGTVTIYLFRERVTDVAPPVGYLVVVEQEDTADPPVLVEVPDEPHVQPLTPREMEVLRPMALGWENEYIAAELEVTLHTVRSHVVNLRGKLNAKSRFDGNCSRLRGRVGLQSKFRAWLPLCERPDGP